MLAALKDKEGNELSCPLISKYSDVQRILCISEVSQSFIKALEELENSCNNMGINAIKEIEDRTTTVIIESRGIDKAYKVISLSQLLKLMKEYGVEDKIDVDRLLISTEDSILFWKIKLIMEKKCIPALEDIVRKIKGILTDDVKMKLRNAAINDSVKWEQLTEIVTEYNKQYNNYNNEDISLQELGIMSNDLMIQSEYLASRKLDDDDLSMWKSNKEVDAMVKKSDE